MRGNTGEKNSEYGHFSRSECETPKPSGKVSLTIHSIFLHETNLVTYISAKKYTKVTLP